MTTPLFQARDLSKSFGGVRAIRELSFDIPARSVFAVIGPNGAGKSTLLNLISGVYRPDRGSLAFDGSDITTAPAHFRARRGIARTFQKIRLFKQLSVIDNVLAGAHAQHRIPPWQYLTHGAKFQRDRRACHEHAQQLLEFVGLSGRVNATAGALSYGEQRMLELARALATRPRLLLIDEPAAGLNAAEAEALLSRIKCLRNDEMTVVLVEHNMELVMNVADRIMVVDYGQHLFEGTPSQVQNSPAVIAAYLGGELV
jgi:ABC-type branched-subunit amino acid transport system ATPase component